MTESTSLLQVQNLHTTLQSAGQPVEAVRGVSFSVNKGQTLCLVGESGSGKSITALSIMGLLPTSGAHHPAGQVLLSPADTQQAAQELLQLPEPERCQLRGGRIAMVFQEPMSSLNPVMKVGDQIIEALLIHEPELGFAAARAKALQALKDVQLPEPELRINDYPHRLSGGQRQRVMIAMAMACEPDLLIADEPTTALDVTVQAEILRLMAELQQRTGMAILFITHDLAVVAQIADQVAVMQQGKIVEQGALAQVLQQPKHDYTRKLLAALPERMSRGERPTVADDVMVSLKALQLYYPVRKGLLRRVVDYVRAVDGVDLNIRKGEVLALVGESGCGKTTLGRTIVRLLAPSAGSIEVDGVDAAQLTGSALKQFRQRVQIIFQDPQASLNPRLRIETALTEPMACHGIGEDAADRHLRAAQALEQVQLDPAYLQRFPHELSGGQRQRVGIARALVLNPEFIVCDEVTSALDVSVQADILHLLLRLRAERGLTLLFITHDIGVVEYVSDETAVMYGGKIVERGPTAEVCGNPQHPYTQKLLAAVPRLQ